MHVVNIDLKPSLKKNNLRQNEMKNIIKFLLKYIQYIS